MSDELDNFNPSDAKYLIELEAGNQSQIIFVYGDRMPLDGVCTVLKQVSINTAGTFTLYMFYSIDKGLCMYYPLLWCKDGNTLYAECSNKQFSVSEVKEAIKHTPID